MPKDILSRNFCIIIFILIQYFDGALTYIGIMNFGLGIEANPIMRMLIIELGCGQALIFAKIIASLLGIALHIHVRQAYYAIIFISSFYITFAIFPWIKILFF